MNGLMNLVIFPREPFETPGGHTFKTFADHFASGGGYGGIEDPRVTKVGDKIYITYVAFDGATPPRAAMSSIRLMISLIEDGIDGKGPNLFCSGNGQ